jgi:hypothetical protein
MFHTIKLSDLIGVQLATKLASGSSILLLHHTASLRQRHTTCKQFPDKLYLFLCKPFLEQVNVTSKVICFNVVGSRLYALFTRQLLRRGTKTMSRLHCW